MTAAFFVEVLEILKIKLGKEENENDEFTGVLGGNAYTFHGR